MGVTPLVATHRLVIDYTSDLSHKEYLYCTAELVGGVWELVRFSGGDVDIATFIGEYVLLVKPLFASSSQFVDWILEQYMAGSWVEVASGSIGVAGTNASAVATAGSELTWTFRDVSNHKVRFRHLGAVVGISGSFKLGYAGLSGVYKAFVDDVLNGAATHIGAVMTGRAAEQLVSFGALVVSYNRKSRRRLGAV